MQKLSLTLSLMLALPFASTLAHAQDKNQALQKAHAALEQGNAQKAWDILYPELETMAGEPAFDYLLGQSALGSGQKTQAIMAFDRCLAVEPRNGNCRLGIAQAHMALQENLSAQQELHSIKSTNPPEEVARLVDSYIGLISGAATNRKPQIRAWVELTGGYDSNTNVAPTSSTITLPGGSNFAGGTFTSAKDSSSFGRLSANLNFNAPINDKWEILGGLSGQSSRYGQTHKDSYFDRNNQVDGYLGASIRKEQHRFAVIAQGQQYNLHGESYRNMRGITGQHSYSLTPRSQVSSYLQRARLDYRYKNNRGLQDVDATIAGASLARSLYNDKVVAIVGMHAGQDRKVKSKADKNINADYYGLRAGGTWFFRDNWEASSSLMLEQKKYQGKHREAQFITFDKRRRDRLAAAELSAAWYLQPRLSLRGQYSYTYNNSNIEIRKYKRQIVTMGVRYEIF